MDFTLVQGVGLTGLSRLGVVEMEVLVKSGFRDSWLIRLGLALVLGCLWTWGADTGKAHAQAGPDVPRLVQDLLNRNGVRMVALDFYTTNCPPCEKAKPHWKKMLRKYRARGLRFVVVPRSVEGICANVGWNPDKITNCDPEGRVARAFGVTGYPQAFVWSWDGAMLLQNESDVQEVKRVVSKALDAMPRVRLKNGGKNPAEVERVAPLLELLREELTRTKKLQVVQDPKAEAAIDKLIQDSFDPRYAEKSQCALGTKLAANSLLEVGLFKVEQRIRLKLNLVPATKSCSNETVTVPYDARDPDASVQEATQEMLSRLKGKLQMPTPGKGPVAGAAQGPTTQMGTVTLRVDNVDEVRYSIDNGQFSGVLTKGKATSLVVPQRKEEYAVTLRKEGYYPIKSTFQLDAGKTKYNLYRAMAPEVAGSSAGEPGILKLRSEPPGADIFIDNRPTGKTTPKDLTIAPGPHSYSLRLTGYGEHTGTVTVKSQDITQPPGGTIALVANFAPVTLRVFPSNADLYIDGKRKRLSNGLFIEDRMMAGGYNIRVQADLYHAYEGTLFVEREKEVKQTFTLKPAHGSLKIRLAKTLTDGRPWAPEIYIDGQPETLDRQDADPASMTLVLPKLSSGEIDVEVRHPNYRVWKKTKVKVVDERQTSLDVALVPTFGQLPVTSEPEGLKVKIDGELVGGVTPMTLNLEAGNHEVEVLSPAAHYQGKTSSVVIEAGKRHRGVSERLALAYGHVLVTTDPPEAQVFVDGKEVGYSSLKTRVLAGSRQIDAVKNGWTRTRQVVDVPKDGTRTVSIQLTRMGAIDVECVVPKDQTRPVFISLDGQEKPGVKASFDGLSEGSHTVRCRIDGGIERLKTVSTRPGARATAIIDLGDREFILKEYSSEASTKRLGGIALSVVTVGLAVGGAVMLFDADELNQQALEADETFKSTTDAGAALDAQADLANYTQERDIAAITGWSLLGGAALSLTGAIILFATMPDKPDFGTDVGSRPALQWSISPRDGGLMFGLSGSGF
jgi:thiol-disulfide isomerase/thioredoxin